mmetsp:Transcript_32476/g.70198  ORF Transcript_32476/g.70198 Transcript_32476/m.70198 type:complete len:180 (-) Transcript_32476:24-563(-)
MWSDPHARDSLTDTQHTTNSTHCTLMIRIHFNPLTCREQKVSGRTPTAATAKPTLERQWREGGRTLLRTLFNTGKSSVFSVPVDPVAHCCPDYLDVISAPMDLGTAANKLDKDEYQDPAELVADIRQTFKNAMIYNAEGHWVHDLASKFALTAERLVKSKLGNFEADSELEELLRKKDT